MPKNTAETKLYSEAYLKFKNALPLSEDYVEKMYTSKFARHFWTEGELAAMSSKYLDRPSAKA